MVEGFILPPSGDSLDAPVEITPEVLKRWARNKLTDKEAALLPMIVMDMEDAKLALAQSTMYSVVLFEEFAKGCGPKVTGDQIAPWALKMAQHLQERYACVLKDTFGAQDIESIRKDIRDHFFGKKATHGHPKQRPMER